MVRAPARLVGAAELMEAPDADPDELARTLEDLAWINRFLGGWRVIRRQLGPLLPALPTPIRVLDVGTGLADIPRTLVRWARQRGLPVQIEAVDRHAQIVRLARRASLGYPEIRVERAEALSLPFPDGSFDIVLASLVLHHTDGSESVRLLCELDRVARHAVVVNDLRRGRWPFLVTWVCLRLLSRSRFTRHDGPLSVRRSFLPHELLALAERAGWERARLSRHAFFRLALVGVKAGGRSVEPDKPSGRPAPGPFPS